MSSYRPSARPGGLVSTARSSSSPRPGASQFSFGPGGGAQVLGQSQPENGAWRLAVRVPKAAALTARVTYLPGWHILADGRPLPVHEVDGLFVGATVPARTRTIVVRYWPGGMTTGFDLVEWQLRVAAGEPLPVAQSAITISGHAIEARIYAEDPDRQFMPSPGTITHLREPSGPGLRLDSGVYSGYTVPFDYAPLLAKLAAWGPSRDRAIGRMDRALAEYSIAGIRTNTAFFREILADPEFREGRLSTAFLDGFFARRIAHVPGVEMEAVAAIAAAMCLPRSVPVTTEPRSGWLVAAREGNLR